jgi:hypothetical protein
MNNNRVLLETVNEAFDYFAWRAYELKTDDAYYLKAMMKYIELLEEDLKELQ